MRGPLIAPDNPPPLFARARMSDPATSHLAAALVNRTGTAADHAAIVFDVLSDHPHSTYRELAAQIVGLDATEVMRRLDTLAKRGLARKSGARVCGVGGKLCSTWATT